MQGFQRLRRASTGPHGWGGAGNPWWGAPKFCGICAKIACAPPPSGETLSCLYVSIWAYISRYIVGGPIKGTGGGPIKGTGGSRVKFLVWTYVVGLVMGGQELFTELKNLAVLLRYGSSKLAPTRAISGIWPYLYRDFAKNRVWKHLFFLTPPPVLDLETQFSGYD